MIYYASSDWLPTDNNPFSYNGEYDDKWSAFIYDTEAKYYTQIEARAKLFTIRVSSKMDKDYERLIDFINYETKYNRNIIIKADIEVMHIIDNLSIVEQNRNKIRKTDTRWCVHSTTIDSWEKIKKDKFLFSPDELRKRGNIINEIGLKHYLEPKDYSEYIMLDTLNGCSELVVNSRQLGYVCTNGDMVYTPGARLYFDAYKMIEDGLVERDGLHILKVKKQVPLEKYLVMVVTENMALDKKNWTPTSYTEWANNYFLKYVENI